ncbi:MAG: flippase-like domain-containing protein [Candidatus Eisenbacteria bacterium]|uniref:Flippase-like domain-containing protein n=1 Tax=Eiseniibacteriota bacterium TaxID=2212470 RepID=A0A9D6L9T6_UNCEI|nr:flippase-like domain-containing protein [Candidatus Eisenbacteria bacterium]MBI3540240.1 flippase-like domain-containing protein [Candidatus Eisenbacteria bacterium]
MKRLQIVIGIAVSAVCLWLSMRDVDPRAVAMALSHANYLGFAAAVATTILGFWLRAVRWRSLIASPRRLTTESLFSATMIGFMANNILPLRLGEFVRPWALSRREGLSKSTLLATVVVERAVDMLTLLAILGLALFVHPISAATEAGRMTRAGAGVLVATCVGLTLFVVALERSPRLAAAAIGRLSAPLPERVRARVAGMLTHFVEGLGLFRDLPRLAWVFLLSFLMFAVVVVGLQASLWALGIDLPWYAGLVMLVITAIGIMVPAAPGYIGTMNVACIAGLALFAVGKDRAVPFSWFYWASQWLPVTLVGFICLQREGISLRTLGRAQENA